MPKLNADHRRYVRNLWDQMRASAKEAAFQDKLWNQLNDELNDYLDREGTTDIVQREKVKGQSLALKNAFAAGQWHQGNAQFYANLIQAEKAAMEMLNGGPMWEA